MATDLEKTQHYTTEAFQICGNLIEDIPIGVQLVEPFVGEGDLLSLFPNHAWITYDIDNTVNANFYQDTLKMPPDYNGKWVITNPPFLAKNKATDKSYFTLSKYDDLYKIALHSIIGCEGGIIIVPLNFLTDEASNDIRTEFLSKYEIININVFTEPVFKTTTYSVCSFSFRRAVNKAQDLHINILPNKDLLNCSIAKVYGYRLAGKELTDIENTKSIYGRLTAESKDNITNLKLYALDTHTEKIRIEYDTVPFVGKQTDRTYLTFTTKKVLTEEQQKKIAECFNGNLNQLRAQYCNLILTNYRDWNRKRIGFTFAYKLLSKITNELGY